MIGRQNDRQAQCPPRHALVTSARIPRCSNPASTPRADCADGSAMVCTGNGKALSTRAPMRARPWRNWAMRRARRARNKSPAVAFAVSAARAAAIGGDRWRTGCGPGCRRHVRPIRSMSLAPSSTASGAPNPFASELPALICGPRSPIPCQCAATAKPESATLLPAEAADHAQRLGVVDDQMPAVLRRGAAPAQAMARAARRTGKHRR